MALVKQNGYTAEDYWNLPDGERAELVNGELFDLAAPSRIHQELVGGFFQVIKNHIDLQKLPCKVYTAPFVVNINSDESDFVEPDISVICDEKKLSDRGCEGAPDFIIEIVSPSNSRWDYIVKSGLYSGAGVREYWIVDPQKNRTTIYRFETDSAPVVVPFDQSAEVGISKGFHIRVADLL